MKADANIKCFKRSKLTNEKFSILIPTLNNLAYLQLCIKSIRNNSFYKHQLIVHVNEGIDGTKEWISQQPDIDYTISNKNIGVCYALNTSRTLASTDYIVYINDDMYVCPGWDLVLFDEIEKLDHKYFFLSSTTIEPVAQSNCSIELDFGKDVANFDEEKLLQQYALLYKEDWQGATWPPNIIHKDVWDIIGGYSIEFSPGLNSDPDFSMKLWKMGIRFFKGVSKSRVYHFGSVSLKRVKRNKGYYMFVAKWRITQNTFSKYYLRRGKIFDGALKEPQLTFFIKLKNIFKKFKAVFFKY